MEYRNFDLRVWEGEGDRYRLLAESEGHGEAAAEIRLDPEDPGLERQLRRLAERETDRAALEALGAELFDRLLAGDVGTLFQRSYGDVEGEEELGLRLRLRLGPPHVAALPWELLYSRSDRAFVATRVASPIVRYVEIPQVQRPLATPFPLRVLVAIPRGGAELPPVSAEEEKTILAKALGGLEADAEVTYLHERHAEKRVTWTGIREGLAEGAYHCFHFIGHGGFHADRGHLALDGEDGEVDYVPDERFAQLFTNHRSMKLVVLNACESATLSTSRPLEGCAAKLVEKGVPAVVAMQYGVRDAAAVDFARSFYHSLFRSAERGRVDVAISQGRQVLAANHPGQRELATPVLFMHTASGVLFVPESGRLWRDLPFSRRSRHTLQAAQEATGSESEAARFRRRIAVAKRSVRVGFGVALLVFAGLWMSVLDLLALETGTEFLTMALGDALAAPGVSDELRVVTLDAGDLTRREKLERVAAVVRDLAAAGAAVVALDASFEVAADGGFAAEPAAGLELAAAIREARPTKVVIGARALRERALAVPEPLRQVVAGAGHLCPETKLGLARSLPISVARGNARLPSFALAAYAAYRGGRVLGTSASAEDLAVVLLPDGSSVHLAPSELEVPEEDPRGACEVIEAGDVVAHRFLRLTPPEILGERVTEAEEIGATGAEDLRGKLVVVGLLGVGDVVEDLSGDRAGVFWQADAVNNLLRDVEIRPLSDWVQLPVLLLLAGGGAALRLRLRHRRLLGRTLAAAAVVAFFGVTVYAYGRFGILINPAYHLVALAFAWWLAGRTADTWLR